MPVNFGAAVKAPPTRKPSGRGTPQPIEIPATQRDQRESGLNGIGQLGQGLLLLTRQYADAATVGTHFPNVARELANLAENYDQLAKPIDLLIQIGPFGALIAAAMPMVMQLAANHNLIDATSGLGGVVPPKMLAAQMQGEMARMQANVVREQQRAMREMQEAQADLSSLMNGGVNDGTPVQG